MTRQAISPRLAIRIFENTNAATKKRTSYRGGRGGCAELREGVSPTLLPSRPRRDHRVLCGEVFSFLSFLPPEDAKAGAVTPPVDRRVERGGDAERQHKARLGRVDDAVIPEARAGVIGMALRFVLRADRRLEFLLLRGIPFRPARAHAVAPHRRQDRGGLLAAHHRNASVGPHP